MAKWKKGDVLISILGNTVIYTGKNKHDERLFEGFVILTNDSDRFPIGYYVRTWSRECFKNEIK